MRPAKLKARPRERLGSAFVNLLALIAIVALLIVLIVPAIERTRQESGLTLCRDNLRKIGSCLSLYARISGGELPVSATVENPHIELLSGVAANKLIGDPTSYYCPSEHRPNLSYSEQNFRAGIIGYYYYSALKPSADPALSKFLRNEVSWPRKIKAGMSPKTWIMSDIWVSAVPTAHAGYKKGVNYLMLDGSVGFVTESPRAQFY